MGGTAFVHKLGQPSSRLDRARYRDFTDQILTKLDKHLSNVQLCDIPAYRDKDSYGDLDILIGSYQPIDFNSIQHTLAAINSIKNGNVWSYAVPLNDIEYFQVDLIQVSPKTFDFAYFYFSYNDLGNLLGRLYHRIGVKLGLDGLKYVIRPADNPTWAFAELTVSRDIDAVLTFAGYNPVRWHEGFNTLEEIFYYVYDNELVYKDMYLLENRNHISRTRDRKRKTYNKFLEWLGNQPDRSIPTLDKNALREQMLHQAFITFPEFESDFLDIMCKVDEHQLVRQKFNGSIVQSIVNLNGKALGKFIQVFKSSREQFNDYVIQTPPDVIQTDIQTFWEQYHD